jgi:hypothetical protein
MYIVGKKGVLYNLLNERKDDSLLRNLLFSPNFEYRSPQKPMHLLNKVELPKEKPVKEMMKLEDCPTSDDDVLDLTMKNINSDPDYSPNKKRVKQKLSPSKPKNKSTPKSAATNFDSSSQKDPFVKETYSASSILLSMVKDVAEKNIEKAFKVEKSGEFEDKNWQKVNKLKTSVKSKQGLEEKTSDSDGDGKGILRNLLKLSPEGKSSQEKKIPKMNAGQKTKKDVSQLPENLPFSSVLQHMAIAYHSASGNEETILKKMPEFEEQLCGKGQSMMKESLKVKIAKRGDSFEIKKKNKNEKINTIAHHEKLEDTVCSNNVIENSGSGSKTLKSSNLTMEDVDAISDRIFTYNAASTNEKTILMRKPESEEQLNAQAQTMAKDVLNVEFKKKKESEKLNRSDLHENMDDTVSSNNFIDNAESGFNKTGNDGFLKSSFLNKQDSEILDKVVSFDCIDSDSGVNTVSHEPNLNEKPTRNIESKNKADVDEIVLFKSLNAPSTEDEESMSDNMDTLESIADKTIRDILNQTINQEYGSDTSDNTDVQIQPGLKSNTNTQVRKFLQSDDLWKPDVLDNSFKAQVVPGVEQNISSFPSVFQRDLTTTDSQEASEQSVSDSEV